MSKKEVAVLVLSYLAIRFVKSAAVGFVHGLASASTKRSENKS